MCVWGFGNFPYRNFRRKVTFYWVLNFPFFFAKWIFVLVDCRVLSWLLATLIDRSSILFRISTLWNFFLVYRRKFTESCDICGRIRRFENRKQDYCIQRNRKRKLKRTHGAKINNKSFQALHNLLFVISMKSFLLKS